MSPQARPPSLRVRPQISDAGLPGSQMPGALLRDRRAWVLLSLVLAGLVAMCAAAAPAPALTAGEPQAGALPEATPTADVDPAALTIMSRNLYLGADVGVALDLLPDMPAAAQFMWEQVRATQFSTRAGLFAEEVISAQPHVIGLQEAATWSCRRGLGEVREVLDFSSLLLGELSRAGHPYVVASAGDRAASNPGYAIPPIPRLTRVHDPQTFQPLFGSDEADCGFTIADVLLVRSDLAGAVVAAGTSEYETRYAVVPLVFTIDRGYSWADLDLAGTAVRVVTTHLESLWDPDEEVPAAEQARQLVADLAGTTAPLIVMGDFNADPRDPRAASSGSTENPGGQPEASAACPEQVPSAGPEPTGQQPGSDLPDAEPDQDADPGIAAEPSTTDDRCNAYWVMRHGGFADAGPDAHSAQNWSWGLSGDLAGPDAQRLEIALAHGNAAGFTDRLDYVFLANGAQEVSARMIGNRWPEGPAWECRDPSQVATTGAASDILVKEGLLTEPITDRGLCLPSDHAGVVAVVDVTAGLGASAGTAPPTHESRRIDLLGWLMILGVTLLAMLVGLIVLCVVLVRRYHRRRRAREAHPTPAGQDDPNGLPGDPDA